MQLGNSDARYGVIPQTIHWLTVIFIAVGWLLGWFMDDFPKAARSYVLLAHMTLGQCVIALLVIRLVWRFADPPPPPEKTRFGRLHEVAAKLSHYALYATSAGGAVRGDRRAAQARQRSADFRSLGFHLALAGRSRHGEKRAASARIFGQRSCAPRRHSCRRGAHAPLAFARSHPGADAAGRKVNDRRVCATRGRIAPRASTSTAISATASCRNDRPGL